MSLWLVLNALGKAVAVALLLLVIIFLSCTVFYFLPSETVSYFDQSAAVTSLLQGLTPVLPVTGHVKTPAAVKGIYMTACTASVPDLRAYLLETIKNTAINSVIVDIKDYTGTVAYNFPNVTGPRGQGCRIADLPTFLDEIHKRGLYAIARVTVFQDPLYSSRYPEVAIQSRAKPGTPWKDTKGLSYIDPNYQSFWKYISSIAKDAYATGFDEINFDYIRFPSDGDVADMRFATPAGLTKADIMVSFFEYLRSELKPLGIVISADIFGQTTVNRDDMGIGQVLENALPYFDYIAPMVYPSHFIKGFMGYANPAAKPYEVVKYTMTTAVLRTVTASSSVEKLRPWLQAFNLGAVYTPFMVHTEMQAVYDSGLTSWMLWDAANRYSKEEF